MNAKTIFINCSPVPQNAVSVNVGPRIRQGSHEVINGDAKFLSPSDVLVIITLWCNV